MHYSYEFKRKCVEMYRDALYPETPEGISEQQFRKEIRKWVRLEELNGPDVLRHKNFNKDWTAEERYELVAQVLSGQSCAAVAYAAGINSGQLYQWVRKYKELGYNGLVNLKKGRPSKEPQMKNKVNPTPLTESEREELIRLRAEVEYMKAEIEVVKIITAGLAGGLFCPSKGLLPAASQDALKSSLQPHVIYYKP